MLPQNLERYFLRGQLPRSRKKGGIQCLPNFVLDSVLFADCLRPLKHDVDNLQDAIQKTLAIVW